MPATRVTPAAALDPYLLPTADGLRFRPATSLADAERVRALVRAAWKLRAPDRYFYDLYERPHDVCAQLIAPLLDGAPLDTLDAICLIGEQHGEAFGTMSLVLDHAARLVELGRGGIRPERQGSGRSTGLVAATRRVLDAFPGYAIAADATVVQPGAGRFAIACGAMPVGLYPSTFVFQPGSVDDWLTELRATRGDRETDALVYRSPQSGLGRFMTAYHLRLPERRAPYAPFVTARQRPLAAWTRDALALPPLAVAQPDRAAPTTIDDLPLTRTRTIRATLGFDLDAAAADAIAAGFETLVVRVPCDPRHRPLADALDRSAALLGGLHPEPDGHWTAGYVLPLGAAHAAAVRAGLAAMARMGCPRAYTPLVRLVAEVNGLAG